MISCIATAGFATRGRRAAVRLDLARSVLAPIECMHSSPLVLPHVFPQIRQRPAGSALQTKTPHVSIPGTNCQHKDSVALLTSCSIRNPRGIPASERRAGFRLRVPARHHAYGRQAPGRRETRTGPIFAGRGVPGRCAQNDLGWSSKPRCEGDASENEDVNRARFGYVGARRARRSY